MSWYNVLLCESKKREHLDFDIIKPQEEQSGNSVKICALLFAEKPCANSNEINTEKIEQFLVKENSSVKSKCSRFSDSHSKQDKNLSVK